MSTPPHSPCPKDTAAPDDASHQPDRPFLQEDDNPFAFDHVRLRFRHDGWTPERQERFIEALAATGCVEHAARAVGKSAASAYALKVRAEAQPFRRAWDAALELGIKRLTEAALSRAIHGVPHPVFYQGQQVGERRHYDERLTMFLLRYRDPARYGPWIDRAESVEEQPDGAALLLRQLLNQLLDRLFTDPNDPAPKATDEADDWDEEEEEDEEDEDEEDDDEESEEAQDAGDTAQRWRTQPWGATQSEKRAQGDGEGRPPEVNAPPQSATPRIRGF